MVSKFLIRICFIFLIFIIMRNLSLSAAHVAPAFSGVILRGSNLYAGKDSKTPIMSGVKKIAVGTKSNKISMLDGQVFEYTPDWQTLVAFNGQKATQIGKYRLVSAEEIEVLSDYDLVKGRGLKVINEQGVVLHENVRAFMPINDRFYLIREADGGWKFFYANGLSGRGRALLKSNLVVGRKKLLFDERGKLHLNQWSPLYGDNLYFD